MSEPCQDFQKSVKLIPWSLPGGEGSHRELPDTDRYSEGEGPFFSPGILGGLFNFLFGTADQKDIDIIKQKVKDLYSNQLAEKKVLEDVISVNNISRWLVNKNRLKINEIISTISGINETISNIQEQLNPLFTARDFLIIQAEASLHHARIRSLLKQLQNDLDLIRQYMSIHATNKLTPNIVDPTDLRQKLIKIQSKLIPTVALPEDPYTNIWHYHKFLTVAPMNHDNKLVLMINIPPVDLDSRMTLYKIHNLPIFEPTIKKIIRISNWRLQLSCNQR